MFELYFIEEKDFVYVKITAKISSNLGVEYFEEIIERYRDKQFIKILVDFREAQISFDDIENVNITTDYVDKKVAPFFKSIKCANLSKTPIQTVLTSLYESLSVSLQVSYKRFSTLEASLYWLGISVEEYQAIIIENPI